MREQMKGRVAALFEAAGARVTSPFELEQEDKRWLY